MAGKLLVLGRYFPGNSFIHHLDPRTKIIGLVFLSAFVLVLESPLSLAVMTLLILAGYVIAGIPLVEMLRGLKTFFWLFIFTAVLQLLWTPGTSLWQFYLGRWAVTITSEGLERGLIIFLRLSTVITGANLISATTSPNRLGSGLGSILSPLKRFKIPVEDFVLAFSIGMQFLPILARETEDIRNAQISRGIGHLDPNPVKRISCLYALFIPVLIRALRRSEELSLAMLSRGYREKGIRTSLYPLAFTRWDAVAVLILAGVIILSTMAGYIHIFQ